MEEYALFKEIIVPYLTMHNCIFFHLVFDLLRTPSLLKQLWMTILRTLFFLEKTPISLSIFEFPC
jgi:hypothetical protein